MRRKHAQREKWKKKKRHFSFSLTEVSKNGKEFYLVRIQNNSFNDFVVVVQLLSHAWLISFPRTTACQASLSFTVSWSLLKFMSTVSLMPPNNLILCHPLFLLPSIFSSIKVFPNESALASGAKVLNQHQSFQWIFRL